MQHLILLHSNDIHGRVEGLARMTTLIDTIRASAPTVPVLYVDLGDVEESSTHISNITRGVAMHRLLNVAGCAAAAVGNGGLLRYGPQVLAEYAAHARYPLLLANLREHDGNPPLGTQPTTIIEVEGLHIGLIGLTASMNNAYRIFGLNELDAATVVRECAGALRQDGADVIIVLSHLGLADDRLLAAVVQNDVQLILGAHTHDLLPEGERIGEVLIAQAGQYAEHLGWLDLRWDGERLAVEQVAVLPITLALAPSERVLAEVREIEAEAQPFLDAVIGNLAAPLDYAIDRECGVGNLLADALRTRMQADVGVVAAGQTFSGPLPAGPLRRGVLWALCTSAANPGVATMSGAQLAALIERGLDSDFAAERPRQLRGQPRGLFHLSGASMRGGQLFVGEAPLDEARDYRVAGSDWELEAYGGYTPADWELEIQYDVPTIMREAVEDYLVGKNNLVVAMERIT